MIQKPGENPPWKEHLNKLTHIAANTLSNLIVYLQHGSEMNKQCVSKEHQYVLTLENTFNYNSLYKLKEKEHWIMSMGT